MSSPLDPYLKALIAQQGPLTIAQFMEIALTHPQWGYYLSRQPIGAQGDFITAPEISQIFGELIGLWCVDLWHKLNVPPPVAFVELGPGKGTLLKDALRAIEKTSNLLEHAQIYLFEINKALKEIQYKALFPYLQKGVKVEWINTLQRLPACPTFFIANEFFDALPIHQFIFNKLWRERCVILNKEKNELAFGLCAPTLKADFLDVKSVEGGIKEISPKAQQWILRIGQHVHTYGGAALIIDYGYVTSKEAQGAGGGTLQAVKDHTYHPLLQDIGSADITAHVDFSYLSQSVQEKIPNLKVFGPQAQGPFLIELGIFVRAQQLLKEMTLKQALESESAVSRLTDPHKMGRLFKVLALTSGPEGAGFRK